jgi:hypothetical protein
MLAGLWRKPIGGMEWRADLEAASTGTDVPDSGPWLVPKGQDAILYPVLRQPSLFEDSLRLSRRPTRANISRFASRYGFLGNPRMLYPKGRSGGFAPGESLDTWLKELVRIAGLWELWELVQRADGEKLAPYFRWHKEPRRVETTYVIANGQLEAEWSRRAREGSLRLTELPRPFEAKFIRLADEERPPDLLERWSVGDVVEPARYLVHLEVNAALRGHVNMAVLPYRGGKISFFPDSLLTAIYIQFAHHLAGPHGTERECVYAHCRNRFVRTRRDQQYCSKNCRELAAYYRRRPLDKCEKPPDRITTPAHTPPVSGLHRQ